MDRVLTESLHRRDEHRGLPLATPTRAGYMSAADKAKLDGLSTAGTATTAGSDTLSAQALRDHITTQHVGAQQHSQLATSADDHPQYLRHDGKRALTADWNAGSYRITAQSIAVGSPGETPAAGRILAEDVIGAVKNIGVAAAKLACAGDTASTCPEWAFWRARNSYASPKAVKADDRIYAFTGYAPDSGGTWRSAGVMVLLADGAPTASTVPSKLLFQSRGTDIAQFRASGDLELMRASSALLIKTGSSNHEKLADHAGIFAKDVSSSAELFALDEAGNVTQISPHDPETGELVLRSENIFTGRRVEVRLEDLIHAVEDLAGRLFMSVTVDPEAVNGT